MKKAATNRNSIVLQTPLNPLLERVYQNQLQYREIILNDEVNEDIIELVTMQIINFNREDDAEEAEAIAAFGDDYKKVYDREEHPITIYINSYGGTIVDGLSVISAIKASGTPVHTVALGKAMSMGLMILMSGHKRSCQLYSTLMYHQLLSNPGYNSLRNIEEYVEHLGYLQNTLEDITKAHTRFSQEQLDDIFVRKHDLYLSSIEAWQLGIVDEIIGVDMAELERQVAPKKKPGRPAKKK